MGEASKINLLVSLFTDKVQFFLVCRIAYAFVECVWIFPYMCISPQPETISKTTRECHGLPWGFPGQPAPVPVETRTRVHGYGFLHIRVVGFVKPAVTIFLILSFSLCYHRMTHVYHVDIGWFPHFLCIVLYMQYSTLCLTCYHAFPVRISYVYLLYSLLLQHGRLLYNLVSSYEIL